jgi:branched-chain amino acid transport system substrate-binding protein
MQLKEANEQGLVPRREPGSATGTGGIMDVKAMSRNLISYGLRALALVAMALLLQACSTGGVNMGNLFKDDKPQSEQAQQQQPQQNPPQPAAAPVKVALLLPLSAPGQTASIGKALKNAAEAALLDAGSRNIELITKDTRGNADGARVAANAALNDGAGLILGPLLSSEVKAVKPIAGQRGVPVIAFSSVASVAGNGVYLMSFLPSEEVSNLVRYAKQQGITNIAAMVPQSAYGSTAEQALNSAAASQHGVQIVAMDRYPRNAGAVSTTSQAVAGKVANPTNNIQGLFVPEGGSMLAAAANALSNAGLSPGRTRMLGNGLWDDRATHIDRPAEWRLVCRRVTCSG